MPIAILVEALPDGRGFRARAGDPFGISVERSTALEATSAVEELMREKLAAGAQIVSINLGTEPARIRTTDPIPDDELTREWLEAIAEYRRECDQKMEQELESLEKQSA